MGYTMKSGRHADTLDLAVAAGNITATTTGPAIETGDRGTLRLELNVLAASGTAPSNVLSVETSKDGVSGWVSVGSFAAVTAAGVTRKVFAGIDRHFRIVETITGTTPSFSRIVSGEAC